ncbi:hypothetical protein BKG69_12515 [Mycobacteroides chelonae]|nr:hypothetical protein BKG69_12515 [Mycobacteroides chelonae]
MVMRARPNMLICRGALESAAHAIWLFSAESDDQRLRRFTQLINRDLNMFHRALERAHKDTDAVDAQIFAIQEECEALGLSAPGDPPGNERLVRAAAQATKNDPDRWAYLWNAASGAGHGQKWFASEGHIVLRETEYEPGHYDQITIQDATLVTETVEAAGNALLHGTFSWLVSSGHEPRMIQAAVRKLQDYFPSDECPDPKPRPFSRLY